MWDAHEIFEEEMNDFSWFERCLHKRTNNIHKFECVIFFVDSIFPIRSAYFRSVLSPFLLKSINSINFSNSIFVKQMTLSKFFQEPLIPFAPLNTEHLSANDNVIESGDYIIIFEKKIKSFPYACFINLKKIIFYQFLGLFKSKDVQFLFIIFLY